MSRLQFFQSSDEVLNANVLAILEEELDDGFDVIPHSDNEAPRLVLMDCGVETCFDNLTDETSIRAMCIDALFCTSNDDDKESGEEA